MELCLQSSLKLVLPYFVTPKLYSTEMKTKGIKRYMYCNQQRLHLSLLEVQIHETVSTGLLGDRDMSDFYILGIL